MTITYNSPAPCSGQGITTGTVTTNINSGTCFTLVQPENYNCFASAGITCTTQSVPFGTHTIQVTPNCPNNSCSITVNGQTQSGINQAYNFIVTNDNLTPNISVVVQCN